MGERRQLRNLGARLVGLACLSMLSACGSTPAAVDSGSRPPAGDAGAMMAHEGVLELGTGADSFVPVSDGDTLGLSRGIQGLQHVYVSLRLREADPELAITEIRLTRERDGVVINEPFRVRLAYEAREDWAELIGAQLVTPREDDAFGESLVLFAHVEGRDGSWAEAEANVQVVWEEEL